MYTAPGNIQKQDTYHIGIGEKACPTDTYDLGPYPYTQ
jgi:hypothetical protein